MNKKLLIASVIGLLFLVGIVLYNHFSVPLFGIGGGFGGGR